MRTRGCIKDAIRVSWCVFPKINTGCRGIYSEFGGSYLWVTVDGRDVGLF